MHKLKIEWSRLHSNEIGDINKWQQALLNGFNPRKGYGFIEPEGGDNDVFVHISAVQNSGLDLLKEGQKVEFTLEEQKNGKSAAENLKIVE